MTASRLFRSVRPVALAALALTAAGPLAAQTPARPSAPSQPAATAPGPESPAAAAAEPAPEVVAPARDDTAPPRTLMFTLRERLTIEAALREGGLIREDADDGDGTAMPAPPKPRLTQPLYLSGLLYRAPGEWTVWINGQALRPGDAGHLFSIADVDDRAVTLAVDWGETTRLVRLEPHQTFLPSHAAVVEGKAY
ncbi:hypothetical protein C882_3316 [Caenispirillum salinarum AK4]|uniref:Uncharacterized protein n=1 Tax=Caenispirillum salinarum AK4 TaxID=1238182 RepID=K9H3W4_9PROT|nr:hypothetical protein [Caenispirillum salinarum]EKV32252.1 hypothetical protein C882_3316 [Caenispirillum salinarum AK4]